MGVATATRLGGFGDSLMLGWLGSALLSSLREGVKSDETSQSASQLSDGPDSAYSPLWNSGKEGQGGEADGAAPPI